eukprot:CAMPEP_0198234846 /NCGR_PEP_ID=MMETSP1446-20131203/729_1 /TAXON_ID=1461542 ORGANISM="Unidentified sp, Strain CCMP2111" /NCGR_SAMPLE_ID=MMETSP1446 /ASSEMBLY_ACC=CAM_ASM_001112 /LENGTH=73 /DNA_ID=CAMNT_0043915671 /DNA_START=56 /DNA_END=277 /DNA_ORIENTATION=-
MAPLGRGGAALEAFKFAVYLAVPVGLTVAVAFDRNVIEKVIQNRMYVVYPPEGPKPPTNEELWAAIEKKRAQK